MKTKRFFYGLILITLISSCVSQTDYDKLKAENEKLKTDIEECKNGAEKLIANTEKAY